MLSAASETIEIFLHCCRWNSRAEKFGSYEKLSYVSAAAIGSEFGNAGLWRRNTLHVPATYCRLCTWKRYTHCFTSEVL